jgi:large subunit ribosomal protein L4
MKTQIYNQTGKEAGTIDLPESIFGLKWNADLVHQVVVSMQSNARAGTADTKGRGEVRGGGKKPWKQKGTGRARHGSTRSPIWVGGGVTHGPLAEKNYKKKINKKMKSKALFTVLSAKFKKNEILFIDSLDLKNPKTKDGSAIIKSLSKVDGFSRLSGKKSAGLISFSKKDETANRALRNIPSVTINYVKDLNPVEALSYKYLILVSPEESIKLLQSRLA